MEDKLEETEPQASAPSRGRRWLRWGVELALMVAVVSAVSWWRGRDLVASGQEAPQMMLKDHEGGVRELIPKNGKKTFLVFWAPWCTVCRVESDNVSRVKGWLGEDVNVVSVVLAYEGREGIEKFKREQGVTYPILLGGAEAKTMYNISVFPTLYVVDEAGRVEHTNTGYTTTFGMWWRAAF